VLRGSVRLESHHRYEFQARHGAKAVFCDLAIQKAKADAR
jgi:hypothetical protein